MEYSRTEQRRMEKLAAENETLRAEVERLRLLLNAVRIQMKNQDRRESEEPLYRAICSVLAGKEDK
jgi:hypothetical protein